MTFPNKLYFARGLPKNFQGNFTLFFQQWAACSPVLKAESSETPGFDSGLYDWMGTETSSVAMTNLMVSTAMGN